MHKIGQYGKMMGLAHDLIFHVQNEFSTQMLPKCVVHVNLHQIDFQPLVASCQIPSCLLDIASPNDWTIAKKTCKEVERVNGI